MGAQLVIKNGDEAIVLMTEQYITGTYAVIYHYDLETKKTVGSGNQSGDKRKEYDMHKAYRKKAAKMGHEIIEEESTPLETVKIRNAKFWEDNKEFDHGK